MLENGLVEEENLFINSGIWKPWHYWIQKIFDHFDGLLTLQKLWIWSNKTPEDMPKAIDVVQQIRELERLPPEYAEVEEIISMKLMK